VSESVSVPWNLSFNAIYRAIKQCSETTVSLFEASFTLDVFILKFPFESLCRKKISDVTSPLSK